MSVPSLETLIANVGELEELAKLLECDRVKAVSDYRKNVGKYIQDNWTDSIARQFAKLASRDRIDEMLILGAGLCAAYVGAGVVDLSRNAIAHKRAKDALLPVYQEIAVKTQQIVQRVSEDNRTLTRLLLDEKQRNVDNQEEIAKLRQRIGKGEDILRRFMALQAKG